jgi:hypothetical protein
VLSCQGHKTVSLHTRRDNGDIHRFQSSEGKTIEKTTPEKIGTIFRNGVPCGDSGNAMEEILLDGRLRHRHIQGVEFFQVIFKVSVLALSQLLIFFLWL